MRKSVILLCAAGFATAVLSVSPTVAGEKIEEKSNSLNFAAIAQSIANITARKTSLKSENRYSNMIRAHARQNGVPAKLAEAVVRVESNYNAKARGSAGEIGLMQIKLSTARAMGYRGTRKGLYDPNTNLKYGMKYLGGAHQLSGGDTCGTILRYNAGHYAKRMNKTSSHYCAKVKNIMG